MIRPANYPSANPGRGHTLVEAGGMRVAVINLSGGVGLKVARSAEDVILQKAGVCPAPWEQALDTVLPLMDAHAITWWLVSDSPLKRGACPLP